MWCTSVYIFISYLTLSMQWTLPALYSGGGWEGTGTQGQGLCAVHHQRMDSVQPECGNCSFKFFKFKSPRLVTHKTSSIIIRELCLKYLCLLEGVLMIKGSSFQWARQVLICPFFHLHSGQRPAAWGWPLKEAGSEKQDVKGWKYSFKRRALEPGKGSCF